jgi:hypothetical protein
MQSMNSPSAGYSSADHVVDALIAARLIDRGRRQDSVRVVAEVLGSAAAPSAAAPPARHSLPQLVEVVAYLGGALVIAAGTLFLAQEWGDLGFEIRVTMLAVVGAVLAAAGGTAAWVPAGTSLGDEQHDSRRRLAGTMLSGAALVVAFLVGHVADHVLDPGVVDIYWPAVIGATAGVLVAAVGYRLAPTAVGLLAMLTGVVTAVSNVVGGADGYEGEVLGIALFLVGAAWLGLTEMQWFRELTMARVLGVSTALIGAQAPVVTGNHSWVGYVLTSVVAVVGIGIYLGRVAWPYLVGAVVAVTVVVPEAVWDWTDDSLGAIGAVLVTGVTLLLAALAGYRLRAEAVR